MRYSVNLYIILQRKNPAALVFLVVEYRHTQINTRAKMGQPMSLNDGGQYVNSYNTRARA